MIGLFRQKSYKRILDIAAIFAGTAVPCSKKCNNLKQAGKNSYVPC